MVREATDRNTLEQQELLEDLKAVGGKVNLVAIIALGLLAISILLNVALYLHIQRVLHKPCFDPHTGSRPRRIFQPSIASP